MQQIEWDSTGKLIDNNAAKETANKQAISGHSRAELFDKHYFNGGVKVGGYAREGMRDFPAHWLVHSHIMARKPKSVLELGAARGYQVKRLQDAGIDAVGLEISTHCYQTRVCNGIVQHDLCETPWPSTIAGFDLAFSIAVFEHIPEEFLPGIFAELKRVSARGLHGIDFGGQDDGYDKTHCNLKSKEVWRKWFDDVGLQAHEIVDKESLERGNFPPEVAQGDGKVKLNLGSHTVMFHHGWQNLDVGDLGAFAQANGYIYARHDLRQGLPHPTGSVDAIFSSHMLEHFSYRDGLALLKELRRVIKPDGIIRLAVPNAGKLIRMYTDMVENGAFRRPEENELVQLGEMNDGCAEAPTAASKLWSLLLEGHTAIYDGETLLHVLREAGFVPSIVAFRETKLGERGAQLRAETMEFFEPISLFVEAVPEIAGR